MADDLVNIKGVKKFAVLGGTFDPVHNGHISVAREILQKTDIEKVLFIPSGMPPHKDIHEVTDSKTRLEMTMLAVEGEKNMCVSSIEIERKGMTYTVDTISQLKKKLGEKSKFKFIIGADAMHYISTWKDYKKLLKICDFVVVTRPGYKKNQLVSEIEDIEKNFGCDIQFVEVEPVEISSSMVRENVKKGLSVKDMVPEKVAEFIAENKLYK